MKKTFLLLLLIVAVSTASFFTFRYYQENSNQETGAIKIGFIGPLSGDNSSVGFSALKGVQLAKKSLAADNFEIITEDTGCDKTRAVASMQSLIDRDVVAVIGEVCSGASIAALEVANKYKVPMISAGSTSPDLSIADDYFFRTIPSDALQGKYAADLIYRKGFKKLAIIYTNEQYGTSFEKVLRNDFIKLGGDVVASESVERDKLDLSSQVAKVKAADPDAIYLIMNSVTTSVATLKQIKTQKLSMQIFGSESFNDKVLIDDAKEAMEGTIITAVSTGTKEFKLSHKAEYNIDAGLYSPQGYDAFNVLYLAFKKKLLTGEERAASISKVKFEGKSGYIAFDEFGEVSVNYESLVIKNGKVVSLEN